MQRRTGESNLARWWSQKYNLPPNHELFQNRSQSDLYGEWLLDLLDERETLRQQLDEGGNLRSIVDRINVINRALGEATEHFDTLERMWDLQVAAGEDPDLDATQEEAEEWLKNRPSS